MPEKVLIVDDSESAIGPVKAILEKQGYDVTACLYNPDNFELPPGNFDHAIVDGLKNEWFPVARSLKEICDDVIIYSADPEIVRNANGMNYTGLTRYEVSGIGLKNYFH